MFGRQYRVSQEILPRQHQTVADMIQSYDQAHRRIWATKGHYVQRSRPIAYVAPPIIPLPAPMPKTTRHASLAALDHIMQAVATTFGIGVGDILGGGRKVLHCAARQVFWWVARTISKMSYERLAAAANREDHSTAMHGVKRVENDPKLKAIAESIVKALDPAKNRDLMTLACEPSVADVSSPD